MEVVTGPVVFCRFLLMLFLVVLSVFSSHWHLANACPFEVCEPMIKSVFATLDGLDQLITHHTTKIDEARSVQR